MKKNLFLLSFFMSNSLFVFAQNQVNPSQLFGILNVAQAVVNRLSPILVTVALLAFFWYLIKFITKGGESATEKDASFKGMGYSILALFVMVSIWGIIAAIQAFFGVSSQNQPIVSPLPPSMRNQ